MRPTEQFNNSYAHRASSERIFQSELQDSWIEDRCDLPKQRVVQNRCRVCGVHMVRHVEGFSPQLDGLFFANPKRSGESHIDPDTARANDVVHGHVPELTVGRLRERSAIHPLIDRLRRGIRVSQHLTGSIPAERIRQRCIDAGSDRHVASG